MRAITTVQRNAARNIIELARGRGIVLMQFGLEVHAYPPALLKQYSQIQHFLQRYVEAVLLVLHDSVE